MRASEDRAAVELAGVRIKSPVGRLLFEDLSLRLTRGRVAVVGRNGVGKSTLLGVLAGEVAPDAGTRRIAGTVHLVRQSVAPSGESPGEGRKRRLLEAQRANADLLLLDEPTDDLDDAGVAWLRRWLGSFSGCALVVSHDRRLLADFEHFFLVEEAGCRYVAGTFEALEEALERERLEGERRYAGNLQRLAAQEEHTLQVARRKARKKQYGRSRELARGTPRIRLNRKRGEAQVSYGRAAQVREQRLAALREWTRATRRGLAVRLPLELTAPELDETATARSPVLHGVTAVVEGRPLFRGLDLRVERRRVAVVGPNGAGKTTLLRILLGERAPDEGWVERGEARIGSIAQGGSDWMLDDSLALHLTTRGELASLDDVAARLAAHRFPLALAQRPMRSLSPGERVRAALIALYHCAPPVDVLVLDEPTHSLDLLGQRALADALRAWPGGLVVASHDRGFLSAIAIHHTLDLDRVGDSSETSVEAP
ncbi:MAG TPA: ATP-binding cassette domain-containing protein [Polyangiaceae bacterium]|jgi:ATPase subunit of ABC transporter with duplicated ATPase domains